MKRKTILTAAIVLIVAMPLMLMARAFYNASQNARILYRTYELQQSNASPDEVDRELSKLPDSIRQKNR